MKKIEKLIIMAALAAAILVVLLGILANLFLIDKPTGFFGFITGNAVLSCSNSDYPECEGDCSEGMICLPDAQFGGCSCAPATKAKTYCTDSLYPSCGGYCTMGLECRADSSAGICQCMILDEILAKEAVKPEKECVADWQCTTWSICEENKQKRTCFDANKCGVDEGRPAEEQECAINESPTGSTISNQGNIFNRIFEETTPIQKALISGMFLVVLAVIITGIKFIRKTKSKEKPETKKPKKLKPFAISLVIVIFICAIAYPLYLSGPGIEITASTVGINKIIPNVNGYVAEDSFINLYKSLPFWKKIAVANILAVMFTLLFLLVLLVAKKKDIVQ
jgi:hypothetical protein